MHLWPRTFKHIRPQRHVRMKNPPSSSPSHPSSNFLHRPGVTTSSSSTDQPPVRDPHGTTQAQSPTSLPCISQHALPPFSVFCLCNRNLP
ncbi:hypothetical protein VTI74DRAFT_4601 [Chaetomium olivicolor]